MMMTEREKELSRRRMELAQRQNITDMAQYALEWNQLGADFAAVGWTGNAEICYAKASHYGALAQGEYRRRLDESSPIVHLEKAPVLEPDEKMLYCQEEQKYTVHVWATTGWVCGTSGCPDYIEANVFVKFADQQV